MQNNKKNDSGGLPRLIYYASRAILSLALVVSATVKADDYPNWSFKGFGTIGLARSDSNTLGFYRDRTQTRSVKKSFEVAADSRLGLQLDVDINDFWHITAQYIVRDHAGNFFEQNLEWAFLKWNPGDGYEIRAGRMGTDAFLLSDYRNVGYAYPWIRPPHDFYANIPPSHFDGIDIKKTFFLDEGELAFKVMGGYTSTTLNEYYLDYELEGATAMINVVYTTGDWSLRAGYAYLSQEKEIKANSIDTFRSVLDDQTNNFLVPNLNQLTSNTRVKGTSYLQFSSIGLAYDDGTWLVHTEAAYLDEEGQSFVNPDVVNGYLGVGRRISDVTLFARYGISHSLSKKQEPLDINPALMGSPYEDAARGLSQSVATYHNEQETNHQSLSLGLRWDFYPKVAFTAEWSHYWLGENGIGSSVWEHDGHSSKDTPNHLNLVSFGIDFIF